MKPGWKIKTLGDIAEVKGGKRVPKGYKLQSEQTKHPYITVSDFTDDGTIDTSSIRYVSNEVFEQIKRYTISSNDLYLSIAGTIGKTGWVPPDLDGASLTENACKLELHPLIDRDFVYYFTKGDDFTKQAGINTRTAAQPKLALERLKTIKIPLPDSLSEQQSIVGILDEAFDGIATAKANAEKNLQNARALFESHLQSVFTQRGEGWVEKTIGQCFKVRSGDFLPAKVMIETGDIDVYGGNGIAGKHNAKNLSGENIVIGRVGAKCGNVRHVVGDLWLTDNAFYILEYYCEFDLAFLERLLTLKQLRNNAHQAAQPVISYTTIKDVVLEFPVSKAVQKKIADMLDALEIETQRLESIYKQKLTALEELKKSLLHQAFSGAL